MFQRFTQSYTGTDATAEIFIMLAVAFALGYLVRYIYEKIMFEDYYDEIDGFDTETNHVQPVVNSVSKAQPMAFKQDDLKIIEGIGPKIESLLQEGGIDTWHTLSQKTADDIKVILRAAGERYRIHDPSTWPEQAQLAFEGKWDELQEFQDALSGGKDLTKIYK